MLFKFSCEGRCSFLHSFRLPVCFLVVCNIQPTNFNHLFLYLLSRNFLNFIPCFHVVTFWLHFVPPNNITFCQLFLFFWKFFNYNTSNVNVSGMSWFIIFILTNLICFAYGYFLRGYSLLRYFSVICTRFVVVCVGFVKLFTLRTIMVNLILFRFFVSWLKS